MRARWAPIAAVLALLLALPGTSSAEGMKSFKYPYSWVMKSAIRLIKVDLGCKIEEIDQETGFILFEYEYEGVKSPASIEMMDLSSEDEGYLVSVRVVMSKLPSWVETDLIDQLEEKLKSDYGDPPKPKKKPDPPPPKDEDKGDGPEPQ